MWHLIQKCRVIAAALSSRLRLRRLKKIKGLHLHGKIIFLGDPNIEIKNGAQIHIENGVTINSSNLGYHVNMHSPVKLFADKDGAIIRIGENTRIHGTCIHAYVSISIGRNCLIAANCQIIDCNGHELSFEDVDNRVNTHSGGRPVVIEDSVWIGANTIILPGVRIGRGSVIGAGSVVVSDVPPMVIAGGNPARIIKTAEELAQPPSRAAMTAP